jgi:SRSO17 transposase
MTPQEIAEVRPRLAAFAAEMLGDLRRKDQRTAGELYARGLLTDGRRKSMAPMAARLGCAGINRPGEGTGKRPASKE